ncbi:hypothetical protein A2115_00905 [Candidatus Woesebacteria bacterium GWA1_41_8]|uniref:Nudix hydrolase domain-containing protein n=1 Tax=Candidatus Woesebacteria bacterium GWA1_41_8 TaxID=1802471 RepID=A0A1F7WKI0_9BACT|nr:MAG: hypothetical protein A2115_00905 [Candidatus Woesebacteria bacterium GWA1_41_8]
MVIKDKLNWFGKVFELVWSDLDTFDGLEPKKMRQIYGVCFYNDKIVVGKGSRRGKWNLIGGTIEEAETSQEALKREIQEESNMRLLSWRPIGNQEVVPPKGESFHQLRTVCLVEPIGKFEKDPAGSVIEIKMINPKNFKNISTGERSEKELSLVH